MADVTDVVGKDSVKTVQTGDRISFYVYDSSVEITGTVQAVANYAIARSMNTDLAAKHAKIQSIIAATGEVPNEVTDETFFILDTGGTRPTVVAMSWIVNGVVEHVVQGSNYTIKLINCTKAKAELALDILRRANIACSLSIQY